MIKIKRMERYIVGLYENFVRSNQDLKFTSVSGYPWGNAMF